MSKRARAAGGAAALVMAAGLVCGLGSEARAQLRLCTWNITTYSSSSNDTRNTDFRRSIYGVIPSGLALQGQSMSPDVFVGQEMMGASSISQFLGTATTGVLNNNTALAGNNPSPGDWSSAPFLTTATNTDTFSGFFWRTSRVTFVGETIISVGVTGDTNQPPRDTIRYDFRPIGYNAAGATMSVYSVHLKAQGGTNSTGRRLVECQRIRSNAQGVDTNGAGSALPAGYNFLMCGDTNITSSTSSEYQALVAIQANNVGRFFDPIASPGTWNNSATFKYIHTQDPIGAGGMDDRHDQILGGASMFDLHGLEYQGDATATFSTSTWNDPKHSYRGWGNDGTSFNLNLNNTSNAFVGNAIATSLRASALTGGHLPVVANFMVPPKVFPSATTIDFGTVAQGSPAAVALTIANVNSSTSPVELSRWSAGGINSLYYTVSVSGAAFSTPGPSGVIPSRGQPFPLRPSGSQFFYADPGTAGASHVITFNTSSVGTFTGTLTISAPGATESPTVVINLTGTVMAPNTCVQDYNLDGSLNPDDLGDFITDYFAVPAVPGPGGYAILCPGNAPPYDQGYKAGYTQDGSGTCGEPNPDNLGDYITDYFGATCGG